MPRRLLHGAASAVCLAAALLWFQSGCSDGITGEPMVNQPPRTYLWTDTVGLVQTSRVKIHWWGDDPDGFVKGYLVSTDGIAWGWTTSQESTFSVKLEGLDSLVARFRVAAVDMEGNGRWDAQAFAGSIPVGPEPFTDLDSNGVYSNGEPFVDFGAIDPDPPGLNVLVRNTPPVMRFADKTTIPAVTLPVASFLLQPTDLDGDETIARFFVALNDTSAGNWREIPASVSLITIAGDLTDQGASTVPARVFAGTQLTDLGIAIPGMVLDAQNAVYVYAEDLAGARSAVARMPDTTGSWFVRKPAGRRKLLLVDDYPSASPNPDDVYRTALQATLDGSGSTLGDYDVLDLRTYPVPAGLHGPMLLETFRMYQAVFWYGKIASLGYAQNTLPQYLRGGGKVLMTSGFENFIDVLGLPIDFAPVDSLITEYRDTAGVSTSGYIPRVYLGSKVLSTDTVAYPTMVFDRTALFGSYAVAPAPNQGVIYTLDLPKNPPNTQERWIGTPAVGVRSEDGSIIFMTMPMHLMNTIDPVKGSLLVRFFGSVLRDDFGL